MIYYHEQAISPDFDTIAKLKKKQGQLLDLSGDKAILMSAYFHLYNKDLK